MRPFFVYTKSYNDNRTDNAFGDHWNLDLDFPEARRAGVFRVTLCFSENFERV